MLKIVYGHKLYILRSYIEFDDIHIKISVSRTILIKRQLIPCHVFLPASFSKAVVVIIPDTTGHREDYLPYVLFCAQVPCRSLDVGNIPWSQKLNKLKSKKLRTEFTKLISIHVDIYWAIPVGMDVESTGVYLSAFIVTLWSKIVPDPWNQQQIK